MHSFTRGTCGYPVQVAFVSPTADLQLAPRNLPGIAADSRGRAWTDYETADEEHRLMRGQYAMVAACRSSTQAIAHHRAPEHRQDVPAVAF
jgi:hypothetical protein